MGYDEPSSKRSAAIYGEPSVKAKASPWPRRILLAILVLGVGGYLAINPATLQQLSAFAGGGSQPAAGRGAGRGALAAAPVRVSIAETRDVGMEARTLGTVLANSVVTIKSQIDGPLLSAGFKEGQMVRKGDLLFTIDPAPFAAALRQSEAQVARDQAQLASAQADADRAVMLADRGIVSAQQRDQLVANAKALAATVQADEAAADRARLNLGYTTIRSPVNGKTGPFLVFPGNQVHASDAAGLITIQEIQPVKITFNLPQGDLPQLQDRLREGTLIAGVMARGDVGATLTPTDVSDKEIPVKVDFIGNAVDDRTGTIELRATFNNPDLRLVPGELVDVGIRLQTLKQVVSVPRESVNVGQNGNYVFVVDDSMKSEMRPVTVLYQDQFIAALGSGVKPGERVVTDGQLRLTPGAPVTITQAASGDVAPKSAPQASAGPVGAKAAGPQDGGASAGRGQGPAGRRGG